jgi:predicted Zn-dependent protease
MREINLREDSYRFEWEFKVVDWDRVNALCLPAGKVIVFAELPDFVRGDDELAAVMGHEMAHALAHHASECIARNPADFQALKAVGGRLGKLEIPHRQSILQALDASTALQDLSYNRFQETEADHIGVFLMTFTGYDTRAAIAFWPRMREASSGGIHIPGILSDHPAAARRLAQLEEWVPLAEGARRAYEQGQIAPEMTR